MPPSLKLDQIVDFNLYLIRAILNGCGDELSTLPERTSFDDSGKFCKAESSRTTKYALNSLAQLAS